MKKWMILMICMMLTLLCCCALADVEINEDNFPDEEFRRWASVYDEDEDGFLSNEEISAVKRLSIYNYGIYSLKGIEFFTSLVDLVCSDNQLTTLDISKNVKLEELDCSNNKLTTLDVSKNSRLVYLDCGHNKLTTLDVSKNTRLETLYCGNNKLTTLDVSKNTRLKELYCNKNIISKLDISKNSRLDYLECYENQITKLDVTKCPTLKVIVENGKRKTSNGHDVWKDRDGEEVLIVDQIVTVTAGKFVSKPTLKNYKVTVSGQNYKLDFSKNTAVFTGPKDKNTKSIKIPDTVKYGGQKFKVTEIAAKSCQWLENLQSVSIGKNVKKIGSCAFDGCARLKKITIKTKLLTAKNVGNYAFAIEYKKPTVKCPKDKLAEYKKFLPKKGMPKKAKYTK